MSCSTPSRSAQRSQTRRSLTSVSPTSKKAAPMPAAPRDGIRMSAPLRAQVGQDGQDAPVVVLAGRHPELGEDRGDVLLHASLADAEAVADALVRPALGDQLQDLRLALGQAVERAAAADARQQPGDDLAIERR